MLAAILSVLLVAGDVEAHPPAAWTCMWTNGTVEVRRGFVPGRAWGTTFATYSYGHPAVLSFTTERDGAILLRSEVRTDRLPPTTWTEARRPSWMTTLPTKRGRTPPIMFELDLDTHVAKLISIHPLANGRTYVYKLFYLCDPD